MRPRTWLWIVLTGLLLALAVVILQVRANQDRIKAWALQQAEAQFGRKLEVGDVRLVVSPRMRLELSNVMIGDRDPPHVLFSARRIEIVLRLRSLLKRRLVATRVAMEEPSVRLFRNPADHWNIAGDPRPPSAPAAEPGPPLALLSAVRELVIKNGAIRIVDHGHTGGPFVVEAKHVEGRVALKTGGLPITVKLAARLQGPQREAPLSLVGHVDHAAVPVTIRQANLTGMIPALQFEGTLEARDVDLRLVATWGPSPGILDGLDGLDGLVHLRSQIRVTPATSGYDLMLSNLRADLAPLSVTGQARVSGLATGRPILALTFSTAPFRIDDLRARFPVRTLLPEVHRILTEHQIGGTVEAVTATMTASLGPEPEVSFTGDLRVRDARAFVGDDRTPIRNLSGAVAIEPTAIRAVGLTGFYGPLRVTTGQAVMSFPREGPWLELDVTGTIAAADLAGTLAKANLADDVKAFLAELREVQGESLASFRLAGSLTKADGPEMTGGEVVLHHVAFRTPRLPEPVVGLAGRIAFSRNGASLDRVTWRMGDSWFEVEGATAGSGTILRNVTLRARLEATQLARLLPADVLPYGVVTGPVSTVAVLDGPIDDPVITARLWLTDAALAFPGVIDKPPGQQALVEVEARVPRPKTVMLKRVALHLPPVHLEGNGTLQFTDPFRLEASVVSGPITVAGGKIGRTVLAGLEAGTLDLSLKVSGTGRDWTAWRYRGWVSLTGGQVPAGGLDHPLEDVTLRLRLNEQAIDITRLAFRIQDSDVTLTGMLRNWARSPRAHLEIESSQFDLDLLIPKGDRSPVRDFLEALAASGHVSANFEIRRGLYKALALTDLSGRVRIGDGVLDLPRITGRTGDGVVVAHALVRLPKREPADAEVSLRVTGLPFEQVEQVMGDQERLITGNLAARAMIRGHGRDEAGVWHSLNGVVGFSIKQGRFHRGTILPKVLGFLNLPSLLQGKVDLTQDGLPFERISGSLAIKDGVIRDERLTIDSPVLKLSAAGSYDLTKDRVDAVVAVSPLGSYSDLLKSIPLFGRLFVGERQGIDTALFAVRGSIHEPDVRYLPLKSFATGLTGLAHLALDVLTNTVLLPARLIDPVDDLDHTFDPGQAPGG